MADPPRHTGRCTPPLPTLHPRRPPHPHSPLVEAGAEQSPQTPALPQGAEEEVRLRLKSRGDMRMIRDNTDWCE